MTIVSEQQHTLLAGEEDNRTPQILYGKLAHSSIEEDDKIFGDNNNSSDENVVKVLISSANWKTNDEIEFENARGTAYITSDKLLFLCSTSEDHSVVIDAQCIQLHAQTAEEEGENCGVYLQLDDFSSPSEDEVVEFSMTLPSSSDCQTLFEALSLLVSMNPVDESDDDEMFTGGDNNHFLSEEMVSQNNDFIEEEQNGKKPSNEERNTMLDRLDSLLVIPPHLDNDNENNNNNITEGQFEDADTDELL